VITATAGRAHGDDAGHAAGGPVPLLFLAPNTGGGHRSAALAVRDALERDYPGQFAPVVHDPLTGPGAPWVVRRLTTLYAPITRWAPSLWGVLYRASDSGPIMRALQRTLFSRTGRTIETAMEDLQPAMVVSFHALTNEPTRKAAQCLENAPARVTVVTDLVAVHSAWRSGEPDCVVAPSASVALRFQLDGVAAERVIHTGLPVATELGSGPLVGKARAAHRQALGLGAKTFVVLVTGGAEGTGGLSRQVRALARCGLGDLEVVAICGRNQRVEAQLRRLQARARPTRVWVKGFVNNMADWLRCADVVVTRAGPGILAEATCAGAPLLITSHLPGQEEGNTELAVAAGAARYTPTPRDLVREVERLHRDSLALTSMRQASARLGRPGAASEIASLLAALAGPVPDQTEITEAGVVPA
jgi:1,2-diacylglycerol 3-beta-galactosyltransferase